MAESSATQPSTGPTPTPPPPPPTPQSSASHEYAPFTTNPPPRPANSVIPILRIASLDAALPFYASLNFQPLWVHRFEPGFPAFCELAHTEFTDIRVFLSEHKGDANPHGLIYLRVGDVDKFVEKLGVKGEDVEEIGMRDVEVEDPDGNRIRVGSPIC